MSEEEEPTITMNDVLERELALEEEAEAKLAENWGDENACTFEQGYITQPIFACATCSKGGEPFGFCFGCSMNCHVDHDVIELFDKRHFKCDCGTPKSGCTCKFSEDSRLQNNAENKYTQNFDGKYCWCSQAYDPDVDIMSQCVICEDWFHHTCVTRRGPVPDESTYKGFVCHNCVEKHPFFLRYPQLQPSLQSSATNANTTAVNTTTTKPESKTEETTTTSATTETTQDETDKPDVKKDEGTEAKKEEKQATTTEDSQKDAKDVKNEATEDKQTTATTEAKTENGTDKSCVLQKHPAPPTPSKYPDIFLIPGWRTELCRCAECTAMYHSSNVAYLLDSADDPDEPEDAERDAAEAAAVEGGEEGRGEKRKRGVSMLESAEKAFLENPQIPHNNKLNLLSGFSDMKTELKEYLRKFAESGKVVTEADIAEFFQELNKKRRI